MLLLTTTHFIRREPDGGVHLEKRDLEAFSNKSFNIPPITVSRFIPTSRSIEQFASGKLPKPTDKIVYIDGAFDLFHVGHIDILEAAKAEGDFLIVGIYDDQTVNQYQGRNLPIMNLYERVLGVLSCRYVDEVVIGAPLEISQEFIRSLRISCVVSGSIPHSYFNLPETYKVPKELGIYKLLKSPSKVNTTEIINRILENHKIYEERNKKKEAKEIGESGIKLTT